MVGGQTWGGGRVSDERATTRDDVPVVAPGSLTGDLAADTDDVATLKQRLGRARERLAFYESFDRIIQENIRRSSELMIEATGLHEQAERAVAGHARAQAELQAQRDADRDHYAALLGGLLAEMDRARASLDTLAGRVNAALGSVAPDARPEPAALQTGTGAAPASRADYESPRASEPAAAHVLAAAPAAAPTQPAPAPAATPTVPADEAAEPRLVEVLVHGVPTARVAISLQDHLRGLDRVSAVEAREFVDGLLRLQVTAAAPLGASDLAGWGDGAGSETIRALPDLLEIGLPGTTER